MSLWVYCSNLSTAYSAGSLQSFKSVPSRAEPKSLGRMAGKNNNFNGELYPRVQGWDRRCCVICQEHTSRVAKVVLAELLHFTFQFSWRVTAAMFYVVQPSDARWLAEHFGAVVRKVYLNHLSSFSFSTFPPSSFINMQGFPLDCWFYIKLSGTESVLDIDDGSTSASLSFRHAFFWMHALTRVTF